MKRIAQNMTITMYIAATVSGMLFTLFRVYLPGVPFILSHWSYGMLAPFQSYLTYNENLLALGRHSKGVWEPIDMSTYKTHGKGEESIKIYLPAYRGLQEEGLHQKYQEYADLLRKREEEHGRLWDEIILEMHRWPRSPAGYEYLRVPVLTEITPL
ncbi:hypothetical protein COU75_00120 [Candidatus Peregrinibacteria bacterium CG10_big_fil_rev_8_21_14_0_10_42_8]|nr:MAG: hypothetical protein COU75_00120 [Candidatus Peregrinibacteria bacterium CG10_big_fil_rev_8_21_14_0_10_42_8]